MLTSTTHSQINNVSKSSNNSELISIVVALFNVEAYATACLESLAKQTYANIEIVCIDDGSTDGTGLICDSFSKNDNRFKVFHTNNSGLSDARNFGITKCNADYICFVDGDDFVDENYVQRLTKLKNEFDADISVLNFFVFDYFSKKKKLFYKKNKTCCLTKEQALKTMLYQQLFDVSAWGKLYKKTLFNSIKYPSKKLYEDNGTTYRLISNANRVAYSSYPGYFYVQRPNSILNSKFNDKKMDGFYLSKQMVEYVSDNFPLAKKSSLCRHVSICFNLLRQTEKNNSVRGLLITEIKTYRGTIFFDLHARPKTKIACLLSLFGFNLFKHHE